MKKISIAIASPSFSNSSLLLEELKFLENTLIHPNTNGNRLQGDALIDFLNFSRANVAIIGLEPMTKNVLESCPHLKMISKYGVGIDNLDLETMKALNIKLGWTVCSNKRSVSELVLAFCFGHFRNVFSSIAKMRNGQWDKNGGRQFSDLTVGIVGLGEISFDLAILMKSFGCKILVSDVSEKTEKCMQIGAKQVPYLELLSQSDVITFHVPSTPITRNMFDQKEIGLVKKDAFIINTARGDIVNFEATCQAVQDKKIGGFAADVFPAEPADCSHLREIENLYFTPHIGGNSAEGILAMGHSAIQHVKNYIKEL